MRWTMAILFVLGLAVLAVPTSAEPRREGPARQGGAGGNESGPRPGYHLLPRFVMEQLDLSAEQMEQVRALEAETKAKLDKILTAEQKKTLDEARPPRRGEGQGQQANADRPRGGGGENGEQVQRGRSRNRQ